MSLPSQNDIDTIVQRIETAAVDIDLNYADWRDLGFALQRNNQNLIPPWKIGRCQFFRSVLKFVKALTITKTLIHHAALIFQQLPAETPDHTPTVSLQQRLLQSLPKKFDSKKYLEVVKLLNILDKAAEKQIEKYLQSNHIERILHGVYRKK